MQIQNQTTESTTVISTAQLCEWDILERWWWESTRRDTAEKSVQYHSITRTAALYSGLMGNDQIPSSELEKSCTFILLIKAEELSKLMQHIFTPLFLF